MCIRDRTRGCHALIRDGAKLVESATDILEELGPLLTETAEPAGSDPRDPEAPDADYQRLIENLGHDPISSDELIRRTGLSAQNIASMLLLPGTQGAGLVLSRRSLLPDRLKDCFLGELYT